MSTVIRSRKSFCKLATTMKDFEKHRTFEEEEAVCCSICSAKDQLNQ
jgi:hypothetical protein